MVEEVTSPSADFIVDPVYSTPVYDSPNADVFRAAAKAAIEDGVNPWTYLREKWNKAKKLGSVELALKDFIVNDARQIIPDSSSVSLSIRSYSDPNSVVMQYRDPASDEVLTATGHDAEEALYATFCGRKTREMKTYKLVCANGLVESIKKPLFVIFQEDYVVKPDDSLIGITGMTNHAASKFAEENDLEVRVTFQGKVDASTPDLSNVEVFEHFKNFDTKRSKGLLLYDVVIHPGDILRKEEYGTWIYVPNPEEN